MDIAAVNMPLPEKMSSHDMQLKCCTNVLIGKNDSKEAINAGLLLLDVSFCETGNCLTVACNY